jgi:anaerobic selenocysteine-containing dehydrogenase
VELIGTELQAAVPPEVFAGRRHADLQQLNSADCDRLGRLDRPLIRCDGSAHHTPIGWDEVHALKADAFHRADPARRASNSSGRSSNGAAFLVQLLLRALGSNNLADCSDLSHAPSTIGLTQVFGSGTSMVNLESLQQADGAVLVGSNAPANHPRLMNELIRLRERGGFVLVINPVLAAGLLTFGSPAFPIRSMLGGGSEIALLLGLQKALLERGAIGLEFVKEHSDGWQALIVQIEATSCVTISARRIPVYVRELIGRTVPGYRPLPISKPASVNSSWPAASSPAPASPPPMAAPSWRPPPCPISPCLRPATSVAWRPESRAWCSA